MILYGSFMANAREPKRHRVEMAQEKKLGESAKTSCLQPQPARLRFLGCGFTGFGISAEPLRFNQPQVPAKTPRPMIPRRLAVVAVASLNPRVLGTASEALASTKLTKLSRC